MTKVCSSGFMIMEGKVPLSGKSG
uniref:Uncharacterized protein n=1 Tax=Rhizophora mucronata TaxID=61149 RepID=A0A2P2KTC1_RHIMU